MSNKNKEYVVYECFGQKYKFVDLDKEAGVLIGTCVKNKKKTWLFDRYIQFDDAYPAPAKLLERHIFNENLSYLP